MNNVDRQYLQTESRYARVLGNRFLAFLCNTSEERLAERFADGRRLQHRQEEVLEQALGVAAQSAALSFQIGSPSISERVGIGPLLEYDASAGMSRANALRVAAGGEVPTVAYTDKGDRALARLARDLFPRLLLERDPMFFPGPQRVPRFLERTWPSHLVSGFASQHPDGPVFEKLVANDPVLDSMFVASSEATGRTGQLWTSHGQGNTVQLRTLADGLLSASVEKLALASDFDQAALIEASLAQLAMLRRLVSGEPTVVPGWIGFMGAQLEGSPLPTPWGTIRRPTPGELDLPVDLPFSPQAGLVLEIDVPLEIRITDPSVETTQSPLMKQFLATSEELQRKSSLLALALMLGLDRQPPVAIAQLWTLLTNPLGQASFSWSITGIPRGSQSISSNDRKRITTWSERISDRYSDRIDIAVKRTLSSLTTRWEAGDRLIDAVVALENLFGTGSGELVFRISASCAHLLERDSEQRRAMQKEVARLYTARSSIVHGSHRANTTQVVHDAEAAADIAIRCLRALFKKRPDLIAAKDRARLLLL